MNHSDHVNLIQRGVPGPGGVWADLGAGGGAFTLALAECIGPTGTIYAVDQDSRALERLARAMQRSYPDVTLHCVTADFTGPLTLPKLDGLLMANSLHYIRRKQPLVQRLRTLLRPGGRLILVEYNTDRGNRFVPHALSYSTWEKISRESGFAHTERLATRPSSFLGEFFAAASW